jgi:hypothetical protein
MNQNYALTETVPFSEFTSVKITENFDALFDVEKTQEENLTSYCQNLMNKIFQLRYSHIPNFLKHHCAIADNPMQWLNKFEKLISVNENLFLKDKNESRLIKFQTCIELKRFKLRYEDTHKSTLRLNKTHINAESEDRYFSFRDVKEKLNSIKIFEEKIVYLTHQKYDYQQSVIDFVNKNLPSFDEQCNNEIARLIEVKKLEEQITKNSTSHQRKKVLGNKIRVNSNLNQLVDVFFQLNRELFIEGKPFLDANSSDFVALICNNFVDKDGYEISQATVETILRPSKYDKRPKSHKRVDIEKLI